MKISLSDQILFLQSVEDVNNEVEAMILCEGMHLSVFQGKIRLLHSIVEKKQRNLVKKAWKIRLEFSEPQFGHQRLAFADQMPKIEKSKYTSEGRESEYQIRSDKKKMDSCD